MGEFCQFQFVPVVEDGMEKIELGNTKDALQKMRVCHQVCVCECV